MKMYHKNIVKKFKLDERVKMKSKINPHKQHQQVFWVSPQKSFNIEICIRIYYQRSALLCKETDSIPLNVN